MHLCLMSKVDYCSAFRLVSQDHHHQHFKQFNSFVRLAVRESLISAFFDYILIFISWM